MADQALAKAVVHQPCIADGAGKAMPASPAQRQRRIAAAIEEQQRLLAPLHRDPDFFGEPRRNKTSARRHLAAQVDRLDMRHVLAAEALWQHHALIATLARVDFGFDRRRCGGQQHRNFGDVGALNRHVAGVIMRAVVLLVGLVMLLIDHNQPEIGIGQKQRGARAHHHLRIARRDRRPVARAGTRRQLGMPFQRPHPETHGKTVEELPGQRDLRHQDQRLFAVTDNFRNRFEIDLGLARTGDAIEQRDVKTAVRRQRAHRVHRGALRAAKNPASRTTDRARAAAVGGGSASVASVPSSTRPSITPTLTPASLAASDFDVQQPV